MKLNINTTLDREQEETPKLSRSEMFEFSLLKGDADLTKIKSQIDEKGREAINNLHTPEEQAILKTAIAEEAYRFGGENVTIDSLCRSKIDDSAIFLNLNESFIRKVDIDTILEKASLDAEKIRSIEAKNS